MMAAPPHRTYLVQLLAMLSTDGQRPFFDRPTSTMSAVSLHRCGKVMTIQAGNSADAVHMLENTTGGTDHLDAWPKPGDVVLVDDQPKWQRAYDGYHRIPRDQRHTVSTLIDPRTWRDTLCPLDVRLENGGHLPSLVQINVSRADLAALDHALANPASRLQRDATRRFVEDQVMAQLRRSGSLNRGVSLRLNYSNIADVSQVLLAAATAHEFHPDRPSPGHADALRAVLRSIQTQAAAQTFGSASAHEPVDVDAS
jgi:hypothetical protein